MHKTSNNPQFHVSDALDYVVLGKDAIRSNDINRAIKWYKMALDAFRSANSISGGKWEVEQARVKEEYAAIVLSRRGVS